MSMCQGFEIKKVSVTWENARTITCQIGAYEMISVLKQKQIVYMQLKVLSNNPSQISSCTFDG